jgi:hypothetical protein
MWVNFNLFFKLKKKTRISGNGYMCPNIMGWLKYDVFTFLIILV